MATKLTLKSESSYLDMDSKDTEKVKMETYTETMDSLKWFLDCYVQFLLANGYSGESIKRYLNYDMCEVWELDEVE